MKTIKRSVGQLQLRVDREGDAKSWTLPCKLESTDRETSREAPKAKALRAG